MPRRVTTQRLEGPGVGIKQHFMTLAGVGHQPKRTTGAQLQMRDLHLVEDAAHHQPFITPVKLERLTQLKTQWDKGFHGQFARLLAPCANEVGHHAVAAPVALGLDLLEQSASRAPAMFGPMRVSLEGLVQCFLKGGEFAVNAFSDVLGRFVAGGVEPLLDRRARQSGDLRNCTVGEFVAQFHAPDLAYHFHGDHLLSTC